MSVQQAPINRDFFGDIPHRSWAIFLISVLGLFLEMLLIRWIGTEIRIFAYLQNTILVACFLGLGLGCFTCRKPIDLRHLFYPMIIILLIIAIPITRSAFSKISELLSVFGDLVIWGMAIVSNPWATGFSVATGLLGTFLLLILIVDIFLPIGRLLGRLMDDHPKPIWAYTVNVAGSLVGTWLFVLLSYLYQPPFVWFIVAGALLLFFIIWGRQGWKQNITLTLVMIVLSWFVNLVPGSVKTIWSPYQKLVVRESNSITANPGDYMITVNNAGYQSMANLSTAHTSADPTRYSPSQQGLSQYDIPLLLHASPKSYLIVGAGSGNDAAGALRNGIQNVTAVEIDPAIIKLGRAYHPENPYSSSAVKVIVADARTFFATTTQKFDIISFSLLDSHTTTSMTNARLDHYVYTQESITKAKSLLADGGVMVLTFEAQKPFIADRMATVLRSVFGQDPIAFRIPSGAYGWGGVMFITGDLTTAKNQIALNSRLNDLIKQWQSAYPLSLTYSTKITTDDWPYIYLRSPSIPVLYFLLIGLVILVLVRSYRKWQAKGLISLWRRSNWHFFFLGAAFLLLEVQNISKASVVFGNTWEVNSVIVSGVLFMALLANLVAYKFPRMPIWIAYLALIGICLSLYFIDLAQFAFLPYLTKTIVIGCLASLPMLFSGIIFIRSFAIVEEKNVALGANLIGSLFGSLLQMITFVAGIKILLLIVAGFYLLSLITAPNLKSLKNLVTALGRGVTESPHS